jgi:hypothetical protein
MKTWDDVKNLYYKVIRPYAIWYGYVPDELADIAYLETYDFFDIPANYLVRMIHQKVVAFIKKDKFGYSGVSVSFSGAMDEIAKKQNDIPEMLIKNEMLESRWGILQERAKNLTEQERLILYFKFEYDLNDNEVGRIFGKSGECARQIKASGLNKLKGAA